MSSAEFFIQRAELNVMLGAYVALKTTWSLNFDKKKKKKKIKKKNKKNITKTCLYIFDPLKHHFYIVKLGFTWVYIIFLISAQKHRLWVLVSTHTLYFEQKYEKY